MAISLEQVEHVANLARLALDEKEKEQLTQQLNKILEYANQLQELDVEDVPPTSHVLPLKNVLREDKARTWLTNEEALANAPDSADGQFRVPAVLEG
ncbi:aspartyl/glutamyl-tRNA(Asn/Gln) amidotransferase subunit C [Collibacillus ludicampi]|jgi:aspartyl-tRNA(Asn)/glutamyl-tRNA(Gln) amidotransferase subunit C|uniref:Aspartyl/glutamyl-tRNA(Asn/Gln) amidotransferase subunit C n=1 Tax=Collibacillus ludicampi TaxID=2771369 RepID=A0AAV4LFD6_9BACL|nr:Asp-tRNA(Asn)/Glu-tRNA(Gln) amidotransferase subunit GatC [Collibacillus ludicampi]GIM46378.1 aspartyl/glutamyl-tRNA(Asn/Gln) amidotransferase subunit C [Collibacillus ludicampi]